MAERYNMRKGMKNQILGAAGVKGAGYVGIQFVAEKPVDG